MVVFIVDKNGKCVYTDDINSPCCDKMLDVFLKAREFDGYIGDQIYIGVDFGLSAGAFAKRTPSVTLPEFQEATRKLVQELGDYNSLDNDYQHYFDSLMYAILCSRAKSGIGKAGSQPT
jgi:hypothetical protein